MEMVRDLNSSRQQLADGSHNGLFVQIAFWIVISPHHENSSMMPGAHHQQVVQIFEIMVIVREKSPILANSLGQVHGVVIAGIPISEGTRTSWPACVNRRVNKEEALSSSK
jgi:hypothetical protein